MLRSLQQAPRLRCISIWIGILALTGLSLSPARAQMGGIDSDGDPGTGGRNMIQGNVYSPSGQRLDRRIRIKLTTLRSGDLTTLTDDSGSFSFRRLAAGSYTVVVDAGKEFEPAFERVDFGGDVTNRRRGGTIGQNITVHIQLRYRATPREGKPGVVDASTAAAPQEALDLYQKAIAAGQSGDSKKAVELLHQAVAVYPEFMIAFNELGQQYLKLGQLDKAVEAFRTALRIAPDAFLPRLNYGIALVFLKQLKEAEAELKLALEKNGSSAVAHYFLGRALAVERKFDAAEKELVQAVNLGGDQMGTAHKYLGVIYQSRGEYARAIAELETYLKLVPGASDADYARKAIKDMKSQPAKR